MESPTKQELRDEIQDLRDEIYELKTSLSGMKNQLEENELLRDKISQKSGELNTQVKELTRQRDFSRSEVDAKKGHRYSALDVYELTAQLSLMDVEKILEAFKNRFDAFAISGEGGFHLPLHQIVVEDGCLQFSYNLNDD